MIYYSTHLHARNVTIPRVDRSLRNHQYYYVNGFHVSTLILSILVGCTSSDPGDGLPSCEELACQGGAVCLDGACRARSCLSLICDSGTVCQGGPLCLSDMEAQAPFCSMDCISGTSCQEGPQCRDAREDLDFDGVASQLDCDDGNALRWPGNPESCDGIDNDCNGATDDEAPCLPGSQCCGAAGCIDPLTHREHCGTCGLPCALYEECVSGTCIDSPAPQINSVEPSPLPTGQWFGAEDVGAFIIRGEHLLGFATVYLSSADGTSVADPFEVVTSEQGLAYTNDQPVLINGAQLPAGPAEIRVVRNDGLESNTLSIEIQGAPVPVITSVSPDPVTIGEEFSFAAYGTGFWGEPKIFIAPDSEPYEWMELPLLWVSETWVRTNSVVLVPTEHSAGTWVTVVRNPDNAQSEQFAFIVESAPSPALTGLLPLEATLGSEVEIELFGFDMFGTPTVLMAPLDDPDSVLPPLAVQFADPNRLVTEPTLLDYERFEVGPYSIWVVNPDETASNQLRFVVLD